MPYEYTYKSYISQKQESYLNILDKIVFMKLFLLTLVTSTLGHKATIWERDGNDQNIQGDYGQCIYVEGTSVGIQAPWGLQVQFYKDDACQKHWFLRAWGTVKFDKPYGYYSVMLAPHNEDNSNSTKAEQGTGGFSASNND